MSTILILCGNDLSILSIDPSEKVYNSPPPGYKRYVCELCNRGIKVLKGTFKDLGILSSIL